jgi:alpha-D-ribose 1-methylphosphonate 5-triphosphate synthase subunit PhnH
MSREAVVLGHRTFRVLLYAMARPGTIHRLPEARDWASSLAEFALAMLDSETGVAALDSNSTEIVLAAAEPVACPLRSPEEADFVVVGGGSALGWMDRLRTGSADYPDSSATLVYLVDSLAATGGDLTWQGPGIPGSVSPEVMGLARDEWQALQLVNSSYPVGLDAFFLDRTGQVMAIPRSTRIEGTLR